LDHADLGPQHMDFSWVSFDRETPSTQNILQIIQPSAMLR